MSIRLTIGGVRRDLVRAAFCEFFGIGDGRADLLVALYERQGEPVPSGLLTYGSRQSLPNRGAVQESISKLRAAMASEAIDLTDSGYCLTEVGLDECRTALTVMAETLARSGQEVERHAERAAGGRRIVR